MGKRILYNIIESVILFVVFMIGWLIVGSLAWPIL